MSLIAADQFVSSPADGEVKWGIGEGHRSQGGVLYCTVHVSFFINTYISSLSLCSRSAAAISD